ncbi:MAG TPA: T9SS type A sorting domain-containing protein, partial [Saprospiraceae bacterium]|nr:T9SS type A sorting domain-containing protein [Saprospiraceae bacterium]
YQYDVVVTDLAGRPVMSTKVNATEGWNVLKLDTSNLASGAYLVRVSNSNGTLAEKIIKY